MLKLNILSWFKKKKTLKMSFMETLNLIDLPVVTFFINGYKYNFLLDTGSTLNIINSEVIDKLNPEFTNETTELFGMEGNSVNCRMCKLFLFYNGSCYVDTFQVHDMSVPFGRIKEETGANIHGILGTGFFQKYEYKIDFKTLIAESKV